ncbi:NADPH-dependent FMN reductase [Galactobacter caseinivorans]|uniref:NADPH-dependent FMN reductase n=1 Tax=Galactobacter caseinivorans TaxID=2676123 RepID=UPI001F1D7599|nr:NADPH-dependent FMN reductase [Galactobacter caseinivorans]
MTPPKEPAVPITVLTLVGSLRAGSTNRALAQAVAHHAPPGVDVVVFEGLGELPFYNDDLQEAGAPASVVALREAVLAADAVLLVTPEYNGGLPAVLGTAIDWISRPYNVGAVRGVPAAVIGTALGRSGGTRAQEIGRRALSIAGAHVLDAEFLAVPGSSKRYAELHPRDDADVERGAAAVLSALAAAAELARVPA